MNMTSESGGQWFLLSGFEYSMRIGETGYHTYPSIYGAPEVIERRDSYIASEKVDIWAFGCILMEVVACGRRKIFTTLDDILLYRSGTLRLSERDNLELGSVALDGLNFLLQRCLQLTPADRPTAEEIVACLGALVKRELADGR